MPLALARGGTCDQQLLVLSLQEKVQFLFIEMCWYFLSGQGTVRNSWKDRPELCQAVRLPQRRVRCWVWLGP